MLADEGIGESGFAALLEVDGRKLLVDTSARPDTVLSESLYRLRSRIGLNRATAVVGAVGAGFTLGAGIDAGNIAR